MLGNWAFLSLIEYCELRGAALNSVFVLRVVVVARPDHRLCFKFNWRQSAEVYPEKAPLPLTTDDSVIIDLATDMADDNHISASSFHYPRITPPHILHHLQSIRQQLIDSGSLDPASCSAGQLGSLLFRIEDLQAGCTSKVPWDLLNDFSIGGAAHVLLSTILSYAKKKNWTEVGIKESTFPGLLAELLLAIEPLRSVPKIYISPTVSSKSAASIEESVQKLQGKIVEFSQASHIVDTGHAAVRTTVKYRIVQKSGTHALLHFCKQPRSQRRWIPLKDIPADAFDDVPNSTSIISEPIRVSLNWILQSDEVNEWLDERDFVLSDEDPSVIKLSRKNGAFSIQGVSGPIAKASPEGNSAQPSKKRRSSITGEKPVQSLKKFRTLSPQISPTQGSDRIHFSLEDDSSLNIVPLISRQPKTQSIENSLPYKDALMVSVEPIQSSSDSQYPVLLPCYSTWFSFDSIHANERKSLHELFSTGENAESLYLQQRNFIVHTYRANPRVHLTATACRKMIAGDAVSLIRIHNFLEQWGIINYHVDPGTLPEYSGPGNPAFISSQVYVHSPWAGVQKLEEFSQNVTALDWTEDENERLLLSVLEHGENWTAVAKAVGNNRTAAECVEQFVQIPLHRRERRFDGDLIQTEHVPVDYRSELLLPFQENAHPILSQVALLASISQPDVAVSALDAFNAKMVSDSSMITDEPVSEADLHVGLEVRVDPFGKGEIAKPIRADGMICVRLPFGYLYTPVDNIMPLHNEIRIPTTNSGEVLNELAKSCMISAAMRSKDVSAAESRSILALVGELVETQMKKIEIKLKQFDEVQVVLSRQRELIEQARQEVFAERIELAHARMKLAHSQSVTTVSTPNPAEISAVSPTNN